MIELRWLYPASAKGALGIADMFGAKPKLIYRDVIKRDEQGNVVMATEWQTAVIAYDDEVE